MSDLKNEISIQVQNNDSMSLKEAGVTSGMEACGGMPDPEGDYCSPSFKEKKDKSGCYYIDSSYSLNDIPHDQQVELYICDRKGHSNTDNRYVTLTAGAVNDPEHYQTGGTLQCGYDGKEASINCKLIGAIQKDENQKDFDVCAYKNDLITCS